MFRYRANLWVFVVPPLLLLNCATAASAAADDKMSDIDSSSKQYVEISTCWRKMVDTGCVRDEGTICNQYVEVWFILTNPPEDGGCKRKKENKKLTKGCSGLIGLCW